MRFLANPDCELKQIAPGVYEVVKKKTQEVIGIQFNKGSRAIYTPEIGEIICEYIANGGSLTKLCELPAMPSYNVILKWRRDHPDFAEMIDMARVDRAEYHRDKVLSTAEEADAVNIQVAKLQVEAHKWAAKTDNPGQYGDKSSLSIGGGASQPLVIVTGIVRDGDDKLEKDVTPSIGESDGNNNSEASDASATDSSISRDTSESFDQ